MNATGLQAYAPDSLPEPEDLPDTRSLHFLCPSSPSLMIGCLSVIRVPCPGDVSMLSLQFSPKYSFNRSLTLRRPTPLAPSADFACGSEFISSFSITSRGMPLPLSTRSTRAPRRPGGRRQNLALLEIVADAVLDGVLDERLQQQAQERHVFELPVDRIQDPYRLAHPRLFDLHIRLDLLDLPPQRRNLLALIEAQPQQVAERGHHLADLAPAVILRLPADRLQRVVQKMRVDLVAQHLELQLLLLPLRPRSVRDQPFDPPDQATVTPIQPAHLVRRDESG